MRYRASLVGLGLGGLLAGCLVPNPLHMVEDGAGLSGSGGTGGTAGANTGATAGQAGVGGSLAGTGGDSGSAGNSGTSGSSGNSMGGTGGASGNAGTAGVGANAGAGGIAGSSGSSASAGMGGSTAGSAGVGGSMISPTTSVRFANLSSFQSAFHVCASVIGANTYSNISAPALNGESIHENTVSSYFPIEPGVYDFAIVDSADTQCSNPLRTTTTTVLQDSFHTLVFFGDIDSGGSLRAYEDRTTTDPSTGFARMIHADPTEYNLTLGSYLGLLSMPPAYTTWTILFGNVNPVDGIAAENMGFPGVDALGYAPISLPIPGNTPLELRYAHNGARAGTYIDSAVELNLGDNATLFVHNFNGTRVTHWCKDSAPAVSGKTDCVEITEIPGDTPPLSIDSMAPAPFGGVRFAHMSPEATVPAVDVCIKPSYFSEWLPDSSQVWVTLNYKQVTGDLDVPFESGYDIKLIAHDPNGPANCQNPAIDAAADLPAVAVDETTQSTWALMGAKMAPGYSIGVSTFANQVGFSSVATASVRWIQGMVAISSGSVGIDGLPPIWGGIAYGVDSDYLTQNLSAGQRLGIDYVGSSAYDLKTPTLVAGQPTTVGRTYTLWGAGIYFGMPAPLFVLCDEDPTVALQSCVELPLAPP